jgi:hypothetical protein
MTKRIVAGVYIERTRAMLIRAEAKSIANERGQPEEQIDVLDLEERAWKASDPDAAILGLRQLATVIAKSGPELNSVAVACYGPFQSMTFGAERYGFLHESNAPPPFQGKDITRTFRAALQIARETTADDGFFSLHTDANACALGEAAARGTLRDHALLFILVTEGIGLGIVSGRDIAASALHPEIGLLPVRVDERDRLRPPRHKVPYTGSLSSLADNRALRARAKKMFGRLPDLESITDDLFWDLRAYYLSQACLAATAILAPHQIVVACDIEPELGDLVARTRGRFASFIKDRLSEREPVFEYPELTEESGLRPFISRPRPMVGLGIPPSIRTTGAIGMCYAAAQRRRPVIVELST